MSTVINPEYEATCTEDDNGQKKWTRNFILRDSEDAEISPIDAYTAAYSYMTNNDTYDDLKAKSISIDTESDGARRVWKFSIEYTTNGNLGGSEGTGNTVVGTLRFSTKGGSTHINKSITTRVKLGNNNLVNNNVPPDFKGLINVQDNVPAGVDIQVPALHVDVTAKVKTSRVTTQFLSQFYNLTGKVNSTSLWGFPAHTLIFRGLDGNTDGAGTCSLTFSFDFSPNVETNTHPFDSFEKRGWEYVWVHSTLTTDANSNSTVATPDGMYCEQVYEEASFAPFNFIVVW